MTNAEILLCSLLECGTSDLTVLDNVGYDLGEIVEQLQTKNIKPTLNGITAEIFYKGRDELSEKLMEMIDDLTSERDNFDEDSGEYEELQDQIDELKNCDPKRDVDWFCNYHDTSIWFHQNKEIYRKYLEDEISEIEHNMGFVFKGS